MQGEHSIYKKGEVVQGFGGSSFFAIILNKGFHSFGMNRFEGATKITKNINIFNFIV